MVFETLLYRTENRVATITLNRPARMNAISLGMPAEIAAAVDQANRDDTVHVIVLIGAGDGFCSGYDLVEFAEAPGEQPGSQLAGESASTGLWDPMADFYGMYEFTQHYMSLWRSYKPTIARVQGPAVAGGSDIALCCDLVLMAEDARIGYPPARVWGCPTTAMWTYRLGAEQAKRMLFTGDRIDGREAERIGLVLKSVPADELDAEVERLAQRISTNVRVLEGALTRLFAFASLVGRPIDMDLTQDCLADILKQSERKITVEEIQRQVAEYFNIRMSDLIGPKRVRTYARPRQVAMYLAKQLTSRSLPEIGRRFGGRDHTTIMHGVRRIEELKATDGQIAEDIEILRRSLEG